VHSSFTSEEDEEAQSLRHTPDDSFTSVSRRIPTGGQDRQTGGLDRQTGGQDRQTVLSSPGSDLFRLDVARIGRTVRKSGPAGVGDRPVCVRVCACMYVCMYACGSKPGAAGVGDRPACVCVCVCLFVCVGVGV
jgi:hypothetical protein